MSILDELWYGNIAPCERDFKKGSTYAELLGYIVRHEEALQKRMNDEEKEIFEKSLIVLSPITAASCALISAGQAAASQPVVRQSRQACPARWIQV